MRELLNTNDLHKFQKYEFGTTGFDLNWQPKGVDFLDENFHELLGVQGIVVHFLLIILLISR